jgi:hypothetical protein
MDPNTALPGFLDFSKYDLPWQMSPPEKAALIQLMDAARPEVAIEIGTYKGGSLQAMVSRAQKVYSIDTDAEVARILGLRFPNVDFRSGDSAVLLPHVLDEIAEREESLGFVLIDGDHSAEGVRADINNVLRHRPRRAVYIVFHDSFNPECRRGILQADWQMCPFIHYVEIDFVPGEFFPEPVDTAAGGSMWGGLALAMMLPEERRGELCVSQSRQGVFTAVYSRSCHHPRRFLFRKIARKLKRKLLG